MRQEQLYVLQDVVKGLETEDWGLEGPDDDRPVVEVPFEDGTVVVSVAWRPAGVETLPSVDGVTTGPFLRKGVTHR